MIFNIQLFLFFIILFNICNGDYTADYWTNQWQWQTICPDLYPHTFKSFTPRGNMTYGNYTRVQHVTGIKQCALSCCTAPTCNVVLVFNSTCYHVQCRESDKCAPLYRQEFANLVDPPSMVLVKPVENDITWNEVLGQIYETNPLLIDAVSNRDSNMMGINCMDNNDCQDNQVCVKHTTDDDKPGDVGVCEEIQSDFVVDSDVKSGKKSPMSMEMDTKPVLKKQLVVSAVSKEVRLPDNQVTLSAFTVPAEQGNEHYNYAWSLLSQPEGHTGTMTDQNLPTVKLSNLSEGLYKFRVVVTSLNAYGEAYANVSVLPPKRINKPPIAIISPSSQIVKLPNTGAVLDGSSSTDDDSVISYHWELQQGPIGYQPNLVDTPTLQLDNLIAGNYTFKLTVQDSDHVTNFTTANITVLKLIDYPPSANAGQDIIIYLPQNTITLNGNLSTDDHGIASWEWTKSPSDQNKAVDMQNTRTPYLQLSNLEEGMYTFVLKVTDDSDQYSTAEVHVFVKPPTNKPPKADAGKDITVALPQTRVKLDGNNSKDDIKIVSYHWEQLSGPNKAEISAANKSVTDATKLTKGIYVFKLTVIDDNGNKDSDTVKVEVTQYKNAPPKANAGGDQVVIAPVSALIINGSQSTDDLKITQWLWTRDPTSLAIGKLIDGTNHSPILMVTDVVPGRYVFKLKVTDDQGLSSEDTVSVIVKSDPQLLHLVELTLNIGAHLLTESQKNSLVVKLQMLLRDEASIVVRDLKPEPHTGRACLIFYVERKDKKVSMTGREVVDRLKEKFKQDSGLLQLSVTSIDTVICQNNCSGHGVCDEESRRCLCEAFWMQNLIQKYFGNGESNCEWSILYVIIALLSLVVFWIGFIWSIICLCQRICGGKSRTRFKKKSTRYSLLQPHLADDDDSGGAFLRQKMAISESDTESDDVLFEHRRFNNNKNNYDHNIRINNSKPRNGFVKSNSKIKT
ncbi:dyslexia-associated protein KIAA0319-like protein [Microplitis demolitor]|uniref:dyslexia-associated protein KIAA0319-like protein n=1 Tax=Microplitis demolitor TaxID=69319 RepID=UPI0004CDCE55|nr:dyslexia-associated protein KIAA0319-like protein [Microplitis demolitor]XP_008555764.1 dyslexia-associated protein KIAA0319-like protein [Microplitis demolitor]XP_008555765.1 dyslexia-associated protein KIAA0319-like protein [Microplitis demolitor]XP_053596362.1 dyslexia-associated protein KIAA0319-like protein [Microplitis demolitor]XP_053596363.1 dyslexia-associated protein KIAA0319-like protein [Microplitis demolitor]XP_053596364.1 dyslexia-associated protein KIAA0319-like protein [Micr